MRSTPSVYPTGQRGATSVLFTWPVSVDGEAFQSPSLTGPPHEIMVDAQNHS